MPPKATDPPRRLPSSVGGPSPASARSERLSSAYARSERLGSAIFDPDGTSCASAHDAVREPIWFVAWLLQAEPLIRMRGFRISNRRVHRRPIPEPEREETFTLAEERETAGIDEVF